MTIQGRECPRCFKIHSPIKSSCDCIPKTEVANTVNKKDIHTKTYYPCPYCGGVYDCVHFCRGPRNDWGNKIT